MRFNSADDDDDDDDIRLAQTHTQSNSKFPIEIDCRLLYTIERASERERGRENDHKAQEMGGKEQV